ncbi:hypothetical protein ACSBR2_014313 [Camellia fascicularis]
MADLQLPYKAGLAGLLYAPAVAEDVTYVAGLSVVAGAANIADVVVSAADEASAADVDVADGTSAVDVYKKDQIETRLKTIYCRISVNGSSGFIWHVRHPKLGDYFTASLTGKRISSSAADHALFFWLMPHKVAFAIYWEALKLWWKGVAFIQHPRYANVGYRQEALIRDMKLQCCPAFSQDIQNYQPLEGSDSDLLKDKNGRNRFTWRDAKWPWLGLFVSRDKALWYTLAITPLKPLKLVFGLPGYD